MGATLLVAKPVSAASALRETVVHIVTQNAPVVLDRWAWHASARIAPSQGMRGIAPLFFQALVPGRAVTVFALPGTPPHALKPIAVATGQQVVPLTGAHPIWNSIPPRSLPVNRVVLLVQPGVTKSLALINTSVLQANCTVCWSQVQFDMNPEYANKLVFDGTKFAIQYVAGRGVGSLLNKALRPNSLIGQLTPVFQRVARFEIDQAVEDYAPRPEWAWQTTRKSSGINLADPPLFTWWSSQSIEQYRHPLLLDKGWTSTQTLRLFETTVPRSNSLSVTFDLARYDPPPSFLNSPNFSLSPSMLHPSSFNPSMYNQP